MSQIWFKDGINYIKIYVKKLKYLYLTHSTTLDCRAAPLTDCLENQKHLKLLIFNNNTDIFVKCTFTFNSSKLYKRYVFIGL